MKIKTLLILSLIFILVFIIYLTTIDKEVYYLNISIDPNNNTYDKYIYSYLEEKGKLEKYVNGFVTSDDRVTDLINIINDNKSININKNKQTIKNALIKADLVTLSIGLNDINYKVGYSSINELYDYADSFLKDINQLLKLIREYCKEDIIMIGYYNTYGSYYDEYFDYINRELKLIADEYDIKFIDISDIYNEKNQDNTIWLDKNENKKLSNKIIEIIENNILKK